MEYTATGNKKLVYHLYIFDGFEENIFTHVHEICLKRFISNFDSAIFSIAVDDLNDYSKIKTGILFVNRICEGIIPYDVFVVKNDSEMREVVTFKQLVFPLIEKGYNEYVFFGHNKGGSLFRENYSIAAWCMMMYYYSFKNIEELYKNFKSGKAFYGPCLYERKEDTSPYRLTRYPNFYPGTFYWMNIKKVKELMGENINYVYSLVNGRYSAEELPRFFGDDNLSSFNNVILRNVTQQHDMYMMNRDMWADYIKIYFGGEEKFINFMDEIMFEIMK